MFLANVFLTRHEPLFALMRAIMLGIQGTWFFQIAFVLYGPKPWEDNHANVEFLAIAFAWHLFIFTGVATVLFVAFHRFSGKRNPRESSDQLQEAISDDDYDEDEAISLEAL